MCALFFAMAFVNTVADSLKDALIVTAPGGGTAVLAFVSVYAVLPASLLFFVVYGVAASRFSRRTLFRATVTVFLTFFAVFAFAAYPARGALHPAALADAAAARLPAGLAGLVGMARNWTFTLFYCVSELWGDACMSLLFWQLANETTDPEDAPAFYPLLGVGANLAQAAAGRGLKALGKTALREGWSFGAQLKIALGACVVFGALALLLQERIADAWERRTRARRQREGREADEAEGTAQPGEESADRAPGSKHAATGRSASPPPPPPSSPPSSPKKKEAMSLLDALAVLSKSPALRALAALALCQGVAFNLLDLAWKHHLHRLVASPHAYAAFLGETAMWTGVVTGAMMLAAPALHARFGWRAVARGTPAVLAFGGIPFFALAMTYTLLTKGGAQAAAASGAAAASAAAGAATGAAAASAAAGAATAATAAAAAAGATTAATAASQLAARFPWLLASSHFLSKRLASPLHAVAHLLPSPSSPLLARRVLVAVAVLGAALQVVGKGSKYSLFKPAEEMVYVGLDAESRSRGKAAIDVVGAQTGKALSAVLQQALLLAARGRFGASLPFVAGVFALCSNRWLAAVDVLARIQEEKARKLREQRRAEQTTKDQEV